MNIYQSLLKELHTLLARQYGINYKNNPAVPSDLRNIYAKIEMVGKGVYAVETDYEDTKPPSINPPVQEKYSPNPTYRFTEE